MYCPRCGAENEPGDRYCAACGAGLRDVAGGGGEQPSVRQRAAGLIGKTRRARIVTVATVVALLAAVVAFAALQTDEDEIPRDAYTVAADRDCLNAKRGIVAARLVFQRQPGPTDASYLARTLLPVIGRWRQQLGELSPPADRIEAAAALDAALLEAELRIGQLARTAPRRETEATLVSARQADEASSAVEEAVAGLGLSRCAEASIGFTPDEN